MQFSAPYLQYITSKIYRKMHTLEENFRRIRNRRKSYSTCSHIFERATRVLFLFDRSKKFRISWKLFTRTLQSKNFAPNLLSSSQALLPNAKFLVHLHLTKLKASSETAYEHFHRLKVTLTAIFLSHSVVRYFTELSTP